MVLASTIHSHGNSSWCSSNRGTRDWGYPQPQTPIGGATHSPTQTHPTYSTTKTSFWAIFRWFVSTHSLQMIVNSMGILPRRFHALLGYHVGGGTKSPRTVHTCAKRPWNETLQLYKNARETLEKRSNYHEWCACVVCASVASIKTNLSLVVMQTKVGATHSPARYYGATHSPCAVGGNVEGSDWDGRMIWRVDNILF